MFSRSTIAVLLSSWTAVNAISSSCKGAITSLALSSEGDCINIGGIIALAGLSSTDSVIPPVESWLKGLCNTEATNPCSDATLQTLTTNITTACGEDLTGAGIPSSIISELPSLVTQYYGVGSLAVCTRDTTSNSSFCAISELNILQSSLGGGTNLSTSNVVSAAIGVISNSTLEKQLACNACAQGAYAIVRPKLNSTLQNEVDSEYNAICGSGFATTSEPSQIVVATGALATQTSNAAARGVSPLPLGSFETSGKLVAVVLGSVLAGASWAVL